MVLEMIDQTIILAGALSLGFCVAIVTLKSFMKLVGK